jgi:hypothetical protein
MAPKKNLKPPKTRKHGQPTVPQPTNTAADKLDTSRPSRLSSITSGRSVQSTARSHQDNDRVTRGNTQHTHPPTAEDSHYMSPSLNAQLKDMDQVFAQATKSITGTSQHSSTSSRVRDNPVQYFLSRLDIDMTIAYSFALTSARDIMDYGANDTHEMLQMLHERTRE